MLLSKVLISERKNSSSLYRSEQTVTLYRDLFFKPPIVSSQREGRQVYLHMRHDAVYFPTNLPMFLPKLPPPSSVYIIIFTVNVKIANSYKTPLNLCRTTRRRITDDHNFCIHGHENLKSQIVFCIRPMVLSIRKILLHAHIYQFPSLCHFFHILIDLPSGRLQRYTLR